MLTILGSSTEHQLELLGPEFGADLAVASPARGRVQLAYWRTGIKSQSLLDIGFDRTSGAILRVTFIILRDIPPNIHNATALKYVEQEGVPLCRVEPWAQNDVHGYPPTKTETGKVSVGVGEELIELKVEGGGSPVTAYRHGQVRFGVDSGDRLIMIQVSAPAERVERLRHRILGKGTDGRRDS